LFVIVKFQIPQAWNSWNYLLVITSKSELHNALLITYMIQRWCSLHCGTLEYPTSRYHRHWHLWLGTNTKMFIILDLVRTKGTLDPVESWQTGSCLRASHLNSHLQKSKFTLLMKLTKHHVTLQWPGLRDSANMRILKLRCNTRSD
jgi:hypothetical protein